MAIQENDNSSNADSNAEDIDLDFDDDDDEDSESEKGAPAWLSSYSDMMTDLMAIFVILFAFAAIATSTENQNIKEELQNIKNQTAVTSTSTATDTGGTASSQFDNVTSTETETKGEDNSQIDDEFDKIYELIKKKIEQSEYAGSILIEKTEEFIKFQFKDNVLFHPDSPVMRETSYDILQYMGDLLYSIDSYIASIEFSGHTAKVGEDSKTNFFAWELSSDRAIAVLKFFVNKCDLPQSKMVVSGYSHYRPVSGNDREEARMQNRRVEIKIVRITPKS